MRKRVPLNAIRAFEAVARNTSVAKAAEELCVTPTAVSHQIRLLEDFLQVELFQRRNSRIYLTPESSANLTRLSRALDLIDESVLSLAGTQEDMHRRLSVAASTSVASFWLMPRIGRFLAKSPGVDLSLHTFLTRKEADTQESDIRICNWHTHSADMQAEPLVEEETIPVCTPELAKRFDNQPTEILRHAPLIHVDRQQQGFDTNYPEWTRYLPEFGVKRDDVTHGPRFNQAGTAIEAARSGVGVHLGRSMLIGDALEKGELVAVGESYPVRTPYYLLSPRKSDNQDTITEFRDWLMATVPTAAQACPAHA